MNIFELFILAIGLSMDAFAVSVCKGLSLGRINAKHMCIAGAWFGGFQALMPLVGYFGGRFFADKVTRYSHWVAFVLLVFIGAGMIKESKEEEHVKGWLLVTAGNVCKNILKHWWRKNRSWQENEETKGRYDEYEIEMLELVLNLPVKYKTVVYLYYYEGCNSVQIAKLLKKPESTIRTYLQKAKKLLKQELIFLMLIRLLLKTPIDSDYHNSIK